MKISSFVGDEVRKKIFVVFQSFDMIVLLTLDRQIAKRIIVKMGLGVEIDPGLFSHDSINHVLNSRRPWFS
jgi:hypothetical protein